ETVYQRDAADTEQHTSSGYSPKWHQGDIFIYVYALSFEMMLRSPKGRHVFLEFLRSEYSEENLMFWIACEELKKDTNPATIAEKVSLDSRVREGINLSLAEPRSLMYEEAQLQIYDLMRRDSFPRFLNSGVYRDLLNSKSTMHRH
uniref:Regulator of G protein signaling 17 n=1 Tax=Cyprinus carpio TaxID=7962 RepID=A0A8C1V6R4_CYPCA